MSDGSEFRRSDASTGKQRRPTVVSRNDRVVVVQSRATASLAEKKTRQLEKVIDDGEQKLMELMDELKDAHDEERRMNAEITKLRLQLDETSSATEFAKKDCKKLSGTYARRQVTYVRSRATLHFYLLQYSKVVLY